MEDGTGRKRSRHSRREGQRNYDRPVKKRHTPTKSKKAKPAPRVLVEYQRIPTNRNLISTMTRIAPNGRLYAPVQSQVDRVNELLEKELSFRFIK